MRADVSPGPLRTLRARPTIPPLRLEVPNRFAFEALRTARAPRFGPDAVRQRSSLPSSLTLTTPAPSLSFDGIVNLDNRAIIGRPIFPPDTEGDVGPNHYVQMNNLVFEVFRKSDGASVLGPLANNTLWAGFGGPCQDLNFGDPIVLYDQGADRWIFSQFAITLTGHQCFAVSATSDPTGVYFRYDFEVSVPPPPFISAFNDYPKIGVWPDAYYLTANEFVGSFRSAIAVAFERDRMLVGDPTARFVKFDVPEVGGQRPPGLQPSHWEGPTLPPTGAPNVFAAQADSVFFGGVDGYELWEFAVDWTDPVSSTFTSLGRVPTADFDITLCAFDPECIPQPATDSRLDPISIFLMYRLMYRNLGGTEVLVGNHTVDAGADRAGVRWFELRKSSSGAWALHQTGTYAPDDGNHRWMGSAAMDRSGNIAVAYSISGSSTFPSIRYNTRAPGDPPGELTGGETSCWAGTGSQDGRPENGPFFRSFRWGDYSTISVDPVDDCTFWLTNEYYSFGLSIDWRTRVCAFTIPGCGAEGTIIVEKVTAGGDGTFDFTTTYGPAFQLSNGGSNNSGPLTPGLYTVTEADPTPAFDLTSAVCDDGSDPGSIDLQAGETVTCTFTNTRRATIVVEKQTDPDGAPGTFNFSGDIGGSIGDEGQLMMQVPPGTYMTTEEDPAPGFDLVDITCADPSGGSGGDVSLLTATFDAAAGETVKCTFTNRQRGMVSLLKTTMGVEDPITIWDFTLTGPSVGVSDSSPPTTVDFGGAKLIPGETYTLCETGIPAAWTLEWQADTDGDGVADTIIPFVAGVNDDPVDPNVGYSRVYDPNFVSPPDTFTNDTRCVNFVVDPAETLAFEIDNQFPGGEPRSTGFWKNWNTCTGGNQAETAARNGGADAGWYILDDLLNDPGYTIGTLRLGGSDCEAAVNVLDKRDVDRGRKRANDAAYNLASQLLAALVNLSAGASRCQAAFDAINAAQVLLADIGFDGTGNYLRRGAQYAQANALAETLDQYNTGMLCLVP